MEDRLQFLATGAKPKKNKDAMKEVLDELKAEGLYYDGNGKTSSKTEDKKKKDKKRKRSQVEDSDSEVEEIKPKKKKAKKE